MQYDMPPSVRPSSQSPPAFVIVVTLLAFILLVICLRQSVCPIHPSVRPVVRPVGRPSAIMPILAIVVLVVLILIVAVHHQVLHRQR